MKSPRTIKLTIVRHKKRNTPNKLWVMSNSKLEILYGIWMVHVQIPSTGCVYDAALEYIESSPLICTIYTKFDPCNPTDRYILCTPYTRVNTYHMVEVLHSTYYNIHRIIATHTKCVFIYDPRNILCYIIRYLLQCFVTKMQLKEIKIMNINETYKIPLFAHCIGPIGVDASGYTFDYILDNWSLSDVIDFLSWARRET